MFNQRKKLKGKLRANYGQVKDDYFDFDRIRLFSDLSPEKKDFFSISDKTCVDLDFEELFQLADRTTSVVGQQFLYAQMRSLPGSPAHQQELEERIKRYQSNPDLRLKTRLLLSKLTKSPVYNLPNLFLEDLLAPPKWGWVLPLLSFSALLTLIGIFIYPKLIILFTGIVVANLVFHYWNKRNLWKYNGTLPDLIRLNSVATDLLKLDQQPDERVEMAIPQLKKLNRQMLPILVESKMTGDLAGAVLFIQELFKIIFLLEPILLFRSLKKIQALQLQIRRVYEYVGKIDSAISIGSLREGSSVTCQPHISQQHKQIIGEDLYHPLIPDCIPNPLTIQGKSMLLTGSNMSGKTTFIRTVGLNVICALTLNTVFGKSFTLPPLKLLSAIRISDDLLNSRSYYLEEVKTILDMIEEGQEARPVLFLLDEIFKGTNTIERIAGGKAVLSNLNKGPNIVLVSTHDIELTSLLAEEYDLYHFSETVKDQSVDFDYLIKKGPLTTRNAINILELNGYPEEVVEEARRLSGELGKN